MDKLTLYIDICCALFALYMPPDSISKGSVEVLDLPAGDLEHFLAFSLTRKINGDEYARGLTITTKHSVVPFQ